MSTWHGRNYGLLACELDTSSTVNTLTLNDQTKCTDVLCLCQTQRCLPQIVFYVQLIKDSGFLNESADINIASPE